MFVPLVSAAMLSPIEPDSDILDLHRNRWADFAETAFSLGYYDKGLKPGFSVNISDLLQKRTIPASGYYNLILPGPYR